VLSITVSGDDFYDEESQEFVSVGDTQLELEHSLVSLSKWESFREKPFLVKGEKTPEEISFYIECMCLTPNVPPEVFARLSRENLQEINEYLNAKMTATWFSETPKSRSNPEVITSELIYYWMIALNIPFECQHWHIERLFTLIKVANVKNSPKKKMPRASAAAERRRINQRNRERLGTSG